MGLLDGKVAVVTGAGRGIGRGEAIELAAEGAKVVVNDTGGELQGRRGDESAADAVVKIIVAKGGEAVANYADVSDWKASASLVEQAIESYGSVDIVINNAGISRPGDLVDLGKEDWDEVIRVHLTGTFTVMRHAARYWRAEAEAGRSRPRAVVNTSSLAGITVSEGGNGNYSAAKAGIAALTQVAAIEFAPIGVRVNAVCPYGYTRIVAFLAGGDPAQETEEFDVFDPRDPGNNAPMVTWLVSDEATHVTGQVFSLRAGAIARMEPWSVGSRVEKEGRWVPAEIGPIVNAEIFRSRIREFSRLREAMDTGFRA